MSYTIQTCCVELILIKFKDGSVKFNVLSLSGCRMHIQGAVVTSESLVDNGFFLHLCILMACNNIIEWSMQVN